MPQAGFTSQLREGRVEPVRRRGRPAPIWAPELMLESPRPARGEGAPPTPVAAPPTPVAGVSGRRTVTIRGHGADPYRNVTRRRPARTVRERAAVRPDRTAMWAVLLGVLLILVAATSSHAATISRQAQGLAHRPAALVAPAPGHALRR